MKIHLRFPVAKLLIRDMLSDDWFEVEVLNDRGYNKEKEGKTKFGDLGKIGLHGSRCNRCNKKNCFEFQYPWKYFTFDSFDGAKTYKDINISNADQFLRLISFLRQTYEFANNYRGAYASLLHLAAKLNCFDALKMFLDDFDFDIDAKSYDGKTALDWALEGGAIQCVEILRNHPKQLAINADKTEAEARAKAEKMAYLKAEINAEPLAQLQAMQQRLEALMAHKFQNLQNQMPWLRLDDETRSSSSNEGLRSGVAFNNRSFYQVPVPENQTAIFPAHLAPKDIDIPENYRCSITGLIMVDPVTTKMGHTYEREAIKSWLDKKNTDPSTGSKLDDKTLNNNIFARQAIDAFLGQNPLLKSSDEIYLPVTWLQKLREAIAQHNSHEVRNLIQRDKRLLARYLVPERTAFHAACEVGTKEILEYILTHLDVEELNLILALPRPNSWQPVILNECLLAAVVRGDIKEMEKVLRLGADIETRDAEWKTPLCRAAQANQLEAVNLLLTNKANISARDAQNNAPLDLAVLQGHNQIIMRLLDQGLPHYQSTSPSDLKQFSYMTLKFTHEMTRGQRIENSVTATSSYSPVETRPASMLTTSTVESNRSGFFTSPSNTAAANDIRLTVEPVNIDREDDEDLKKTNKP